MHKMTAKNHVFDKDCSFTIHNIEYTLKHHQDQGGTVAAKMPGNTHEITF